MVAHRPAVRQLESRRLMQVAADRRRVDRRPAAGRGETRGLIELKRSYEQISRRFLWMMAVGGVRRGRVVVGEAVGFLQATRRLGLVCRAGPCRVGRSLDGFV